MWVVLAIIVLIALRRWARHRAPVDSTPGQWPRIHAGGSGLVDAVRVDRAEPRHTRRRHR